MKKLKTLLAFLFVVLTMNSNAQSTKNDSIKYDMINLGIGMGMEYGGFGGNLTVYPIDFVGIYLGGGYALAGFGYNAGVKVRFISREKYSIVNPYLHAMYGYNASIKIQDADEFDKLFYGPTFGFGLDFGPRGPKKGYFTLAINIPIRSSEVNDYMDDLEENHGVEFETGLLPIAFSVAYRVTIN